jgi:plasmid stability protein
MPSISVRRLDDETYERLRNRAEADGVSMEEEARRILKRAVAAPEKLGSLARELFGPRYGVTLQLPDRSAHEPITFEK